MEAEGDKATDAVEINIEGELESVDVPDAGRSRPAAQARPQRRRLSPGAANNTPGASPSAALTNGRRSRSNSRSPGRRKRDTEMALADAVPLLPSGNHNAGEADLPRQRPPMAGPEIDDEDEEDGVDRTTTGFDPNNPDRGIDNGFLEPAEVRPNDERGTTDRAGRRGGGRRNQGPAFPYAPGFAPDGTLNVQTTDSGQIIPDVNVYQQKKNLAQGMMDLALLSANANQLRYVLDSGNKNHAYYYINLILISSSIIAQVAVGIGLIYKSRYNIKKEEDFCKADRINNLVTIGIFIITIVNVLISAFGMADANPANSN